MGFQFPFSALLSSLALSCMVLKSLFQNSEKLLILWCSSFDSKASNDTNSLQTAAELDMIYTRHEHAII